MRPRCAAIASVGCMEPAVARQRGKGTAISCRRAHEGNHYASRYINELARLLHVTTKAPMRRTRQRHAAVLNMRSVTKVVGRAFPLLYIVGDHARGFHRGLAELGVAGDLTLDALTFGMQEVAQAFELGNQSFDL